MCGHAVACNKRQGSVLFGNMMEYMPIAIRLAAVVLIAAYIFDYLKRKWAKSLMDTIKASGAVSAETAVSTEELEKKCKGMERLVKLFLGKEYSPLRRVINCHVEDNCEELIGKARFGKLTGKERWFIIPPPEVKLGGGENEETVDEKEDAHLPSLLREGAELSVKKIVFGVILTVLFTELIIYFLPQIADFFGNISSLGKE